MRLLDTTVIESRRFWSPRLQTLVCQAYVEPDRAPRPCQPAVMSFELPGPLKELLKKVTGDSDLLVFASVAAALSVCFARYAGQETVVIGSPAQRSIDPGPDNCPDDVALPITIDLTGTPSFRDLLTRVRGTLIEAYAHQSCAYDWMLDEVALQPSADMKSPLFAWALTMEGLHRALPASCIPHATVVLRKSAVGLAGEVQFDEGLFEKRRIERVVEQWMRVLGQGLADLTIPADRLNLMDDVERTQVLQTSWVPASPRPPNATVLSLFEEQVVRTPHVLAVVDVQGRFTYAELKTRADRVAGALEMEGVGPGSLVGIVFDRRREQVVAMLGVLGAGAAYVPLDATVPAERLRSSVTESAMSHIVTDSQHSAELPPLAPRMLLLEALETATPTGSRRRAVLPDEAAYIIFTSGSTGRPKGVVITHRNLVNSTLARQEVYPSAPGSFLLLSPFTFDSSIAGIYGTLTRGGTLHIAPQAVLGDPVRIAELVQDHQCKSLLCLPRMLELILDSAPPAALETLHIAIVAGEACPRSLVDRLSAVPNLSVYNEYGPTEATVWSTVHKLDAGKGFVAIGRPVPGYGAYVLDDSLRLVSMGITGELYLSGDSIARGYLGRPAATAERFLPNPFGSSPGMRMYRTGDLACLSEDGLLDFRGRTDDQIKLRGFRVELQEVVTALRDRPGVLDAAVAVRDEVLVGYVVLASEGGEALKLQEELQGLVPSHLVPSYILQLEALPRLPNGKLDRSRLPSPLRASGSTEAPLTGSFEATLLELFCDVLSRTDLRTDDNFFAVGGDSIKAAILVSRLQQRLGEILYVVAIFERPTVDGLAGYLREKYPVAVMRITGGRPPLSEGVPADGIDDRAVEDFQRLISAPMPTVRAKNKRAIFVVAPPRSGTTLLRVILAGHPSLFSPPELELLAFDTLAERDQALSGPYSFYREGMLRALVEAKGCTADEAEAFIRAKIVEGWASQELYAHLQSSIGGRVLVDKTASYALSLETLKRAEALFEEPLYIHLVRHPQAMVHSFVNARLDTVFLRRKHSYNPRQLAELVWQTCHRNILALQGQIPARRFIQVAFEDLVREPEVVVRRLCDFLCITFIPVMMDPYDDVKRRMTDGVRAGTRMLGDIRFHDHQGIDPQIADAWKVDADSTSLSTRTWSIARALGYDREGLRGSTPASFAQERLWFLQHLHGGSHFNLPIALRVFGPLDPSAVEHATQAIVRRHDILRTVLSAPYDHLVQWFCPDLEPEVTREDLRSTSPDQREQTLQARIREELRRPFDLSTGPLLRLRVFRLDEEDWALLFVMHHIVADARSLEIFSRELTTLYSAQMNGCEPQLAPLQVQYEDYASRERERLNDARLAELLDGAAQRFVGCPMTHFLPTDWPRGYAPSPIGQSKRFEVDSSTYAQLAAFARAEQLTLFSVLLAAFQLLLWRQSGQEDFIVGAPLSDRRTVEENELIGLFLNTLVFRARLDGNPTFRELSRRTRDEVVEALGQQELPFQKLVEALQPDRSLASAALVQVMFSFQELVIDLGEDTGLRFQRIALLSETAKFLDLSIVMTLEANQLVGYLEYDVDLFREETINALIARFLRLLNQVALSPDAPIAMLASLDDTERRHLISLGHGSVQPYDETPIHRRFEQCAARTPDALAIAAPDGTLTYKELNKAAGALADRLQAAGVSFEVPVALLMGRSLELAIGTLAVWKAGGVIVLLDPDSPNERLLEMLAVVSAPITLVASSTRDQASALGACWIEVERVAAGDGPSLDAHPDQLAYIVFTSGTTGAPKGVQLTHRGFVNLVAAHLDEYHVVPEDRATWLAGVGFDVSVWELWPYLCRGASVHVVPEETRYAPRGLLEWFAWHSITMSYLPAQLAMAVLSEAFPAKLKLRALLTGADRLLRQERVDLPFALHNTYGPAEATVTTTWTKLDPEALRRDPPLGRAIANVVHYVVDNGLRLVPAGVPGQLALGGPCLARGYLGRPDLTAVAFLPNPFASEPGARLYLTGDLVAMNPLGDLRFLGRIDNQVKIRGVRVEPEEVAARLLARPGVREAAVVDYVTASGERALAAFVVLVASGISIEALRIYLSERLVAAMQPSLVEEIDVLPLNLNGKLDRRALRERAQSGKHRAPTADIFYSPVEETVAKIFAEVLNVDWVGLDDNFFDLGGHSLLAIKVITRLKAQFGVEVSIRVLFEAPTSRQLAASVSELTAIKDSNPIVRTPQSGPLPLSFEQERLWFLDRFRPNSAAYTMSTVLRIEGALDIDAFRRVVAELVVRHGSLRTTFIEVDGSPRQLVQPTLRVPVVVEQLWDLPADERDVRVRAEAEREACQLFDLKTGPLLKVRLLGLAPQDNVLFLTMHHIVSDLWSMGILLRELSTLYGVFSRNECSPLPEAPFQYADYAIWQRAWFQGPILAAQLRFWKEHLQGAPEFLDLPFDRPRPALQTHRGTHIYFNLSPDVAQGVGVLSRREGTTPFVTLLSVFLVLLSRYSRQDRIVIGTPIANRTRLETESIVGFFVNTLALHNRVEGTFRQLLQSVRERTLEAFANQDLPFERLVQELNPERDMSRSPIFQVMFMLQGAPADEVPPAGLTWRAVEKDSGTTQFDLQLALTQREGGFLGAIQYNSDLFDASTIQRMAEHYRTLVEGILATPDRLVARLPLITEAERQKLLVDWNPLSAQRPVHPTFQVLFEAQVTRSPNRTAMLFRERSLSYSELNRNANQKSHALVRRNVGPDTVVALLCQRSHHLLEAIIGVFKAGGAYLPLDPRHPPQRLAQVLDQVGTPLLLVDEAMANAAQLAVEQLPEHRRPTVLILETLGAGELDDNPPARACPRNLAYVISTSGSTGAPKNVMVDHHNMMNHFMGEARALDLGADDVMGQNLSHCFDASVWQFLGVLWLGGRVLILPDEVAHLPNHLLDAVDGNGVTVLEVVPPLLNLMLDDLAARPRQLEQLRWMRAGGEVLPSELCHRWRALVPGVPMVNSYGPSECTDSMTLHIIRTPPSRPSAPIGFPIDNVQAYVLDRALQLVPIGVPGELYAGGDGVARGYLGRPDLTADRFVPNPFGIQPGERLYRTGDLARWQVDGTLEFLGRADQQVKVRGFRVELGEIEAVLGQHTAIGHALVIEREVRPGETWLVAYFVLRTAAPTPSAEELRSYTAQRLPSYMIPSAFVMLAAFPLNSNSKIDRRALPLPSRETQGLSLFEFPQGPLEEAIAAAWNNVLAVKIGRNDNFFELGGHSLAMVRVQAWLSESLSRQLPLLTLFQHPTVYGLAKHLEQEVIPAAELSWPTRDADPAPAALSFAQERLWFLDQLQPESPIYNLYTALRLTGPLNPDILRRCLAALVERHEALRTRFELLDERPVQLVSNDAEVDLPLEDLTAQTLDEARIQAVRRCTEEALRPFDLTCRSLLRARLFRIGVEEAEEHVLFLNVHHAVSDGWSEGILIRELFTLYGAAEDDQPASLPELPIRYSDYARWQRRTLLSKALDQKLLWWKQKLAGAPVLSLPTDRPRPPVQTFPGDFHRFLIRRTLYDALCNLGREEGATPFMVLTAAFAALLGRRAGQQDILLGTPVANRGHSKLEGVVGLFVNTLVLRIDLSLSPSTRELLRRIREMAIAAYAHLDTPFEQVVEAVGPDRDLGRSVLFQAMISLQNTPSDVPVLPGLAIEPISVPSGMAKFELTLALLERPEGLLASLSFNTDLFERDTIIRLAGHLETLLERMVATPDRAIDRLSLLGAEESALLDRWNETSLPFSSETVHALFEAQVDKTPAAIALVFRGATLTYSELDARANQLARYLQSLGLGPEMRVALCLERSLDMMVALLAILKAGGAYVPLDPSYPEDRLMLMLDDCGASVVVTQGRSRLYSRPVVRIDEDSSEIARHSRERLNPSSTPECLAYVIYTSGSTGNPKGVMVQHRNVANFFSAMDAYIPHPPGSTWLAVTSISFDISVLELLWTLARGFRVVLQSERTIVAREFNRQRSAALQFSLFYFAADTGSDSRSYELLLEGARFADTHGFTAVWTPERHFHEFGGPYPNPAVTSAALAVVTKNVQIRAGSLVLPLHQPIRVAEEWAVVDNLSGGRVGISFTSGWQANDFALAPDAYERRREIMREGIDVIRKLWRGEAVLTRGGDGKEIDVRTFPRPIQPELPVWLTASGTPETFELAGTLGANLLTHLLGQDLDALGVKIEAYREARRRQGLPGRGHVTLMLHTYLDDDLERAREKVREPMKRYLRTSADLLKNLVHGVDPDVELERLSDTDLDTLLERAFDRYFEASGLLGTPESCGRTLDRLSAIDVDEVACLIDFGLETADVLASLERLDVLRKLPAMPRDTSVETQVAYHGATHLQCTPSLWKMVMNEPGAGDALRSVRTLIFGGEPLSHEVAAQGHELIDTKLLNMYGPTETTIWSTAHTLRSIDDLSIGCPIANTRVHVVDEHLQPVPIGVAGELLIGGNGVVRGYLDQPALTADRFLPDPFGPAAGNRLYRTGDVVRFRRDGTLEFLGRLDRQAKVRGHRIEPGEVEAVLAMHVAVRDVVVDVRRDAFGDERLVAYVVFRGDADIAALRDFARAKLPPILVPSVFQPLDTLPLTPNGKLNKRALPEPGRENGDEKSEYIAARDATELQLVRIYEDLFQTQPIGVKENFFALGGHSMLAVRLMSRIRKQFGYQLPLAALFERPTVEELAAALREFEPLHTVSSLVPIQRGAQRRAAVFIHPSSGSVLCYADLIRQLDPEQPFYGLQTVGDKGDIENMAACYVEELSAMDLQGPLILGGWSMGGIIAFEMARQLNERGREVAHVVLIDSPVPTGTAAVPDEEDLIVRFVSDLARLAGTEVPLPALSGRLVEEVIAIAAESARAHGALPPDTSLDDFRRLFSTFRANVLAESRFAPAPYGGAVLLLQGSDNSKAALEESARGWRTLAQGPFRFGLVPGDHYSLLTGVNARALAAEIRSILT